LIYTNGHLDETAEWRLRRRDGGVIWTELAGSRIDREGKPHAIIGIGRDITERKKAEEKLRASEERFRSMFTHASEMIYMYDMAGRFIDTNDRTLELLGCSREEIRGLTIRDIIDPQDIGRSMEGLQRLFAEGEPQGPVELRFRLDDGTRKLMEVTTVRLDLGDGAHAALGIARDITARRDAEEKLRQAAEQMRASQKMEAVGRLASGLSHEFSNVLNVIGGHSELALEGLHDEDPLKESLTEISKAAASGANLTRQLLAFSSSQMLKPEIIDIDEHVKNVGTMLRRLIGEDVELIMKLGGTGKVRADPAQIEQVIMNLAVNARDAMPDGGKLIIETYDADLDDEYASSHAGVQPDGYVIVAVTDTGEGMDERTRQRIFEPFFSTKDRDIGSGLGLSTVFGIVKQSGGNVWVYSEKGRGSTFKIYLPRLEEGDIAARDSKPDPGSLLGVETVLVVEDEDMVRNIVGMTLREHGYTVLEARNAEEALEIFEKGKRTIDVVVSDVVMPGMNGRQLAEKLATDYDHHRILLVSGYPGTAATQQELISEGVEFVSKPVAARTLVGKVREILDRPVRKG
jgi:PAS domain S-box-containing protein